MLTREFGMFSEKGNKAVSKMVSEIQKLPATATDRDVFQILRNGILKIAKSHKEIYDTEVRSRIAEEISLITKKPVAVYKRMMVTVAMS